MRKVYVVTRSTYSREGVIAFEDEADALAFAERYHMLGDDEQPEDYVEAVFVVAGERKPAMRCGQ